MKKIIVILLVILAYYFGLKYLNSPDRKQTIPEKALDSAGSYLPNAVERKNNLESNINDSVNKENARVQNSLDEIK